MYHSTYDNYHWMANFGDPGFHYHAASERIYLMIRIWGSYLVFYSKSRFLFLFLYMTGFANSVNRIRGESDVCESWIWSVWNRVVEYGRKYATYLVPDFDHVNHNLTCLLRVICPIVCVF